MAMDVVPSDTTGDVIIGDTLIRTLRKTDGVHFAPGCRDDEQLRDVLHRLDEPSLSTLIYDQQHGKLVYDQQHGKLDKICRQAA